MSDYAHAQYALAATEAYEEGKAARAAGEPESACPYPGTTTTNHRIRRWLDGWRAADEENVG